MTRVWPLILTLMLAACSTGPETAQDACERQADRDPEVRRLIIIGLGNPYFFHGSQDELRAAKQSATIACLQDRGVIRKGGVERQKPL